MTNRLNKFINELAVNSLANSFKAIDKVQHMFDDFDVEDFGTELIRHRDNIVRQGNAWLSDLGDFFKQVKDTVTAFTVTVPYDSEKEEINTSVEDGVLKIQTTFKDDTTERKTFNSVTIPEDCDVERMTCKVNNDKKVALIVIPKKKTEGDTLKDRINDIVAAARAKATKDVEEPKAEEPINVKKTAKKPIKVKARKPKTKK